MGNKNIFSEHTLFALTAKRVRAEWDRYEVGIVILGARLDVGFSPSASYAGKRFYFHRVGKETR